MRRWISLALALALLGAACGGGDEGATGLPADALVLVVSSDLALGPHRVAVGALDSENRSLVTDQPIQLEFFRPDGSPAGVTPARFIWAIPDVRGLWVADFEFDTPGIWSLGVRTSDDRLSPSQPFNVAADNIGVGIGDPAPQSDSKTLESGALGTISSDTDPDERLYQQTVAEAVTSGRPSVIIFATPAFCTSATCGPSLDVAKDMLDDFDGVEWVHVEVFDNLDATSREELVVVPAVLEWGLQTEPWVFVVDASGAVTARFEGAVGEAELREAVEAVAG